MTRGRSMTEQLPLWPDRLLPFGTHATLDKVPMLVFLGEDDAGMPKYEHHPHCTCKFPKENK